jgi:ubiquinone/menaquinone biosynthesis C-methylase UbiE
MKSPNMFDVKAAEWDSNPRITAMAEAFFAQLKQHVPLTPGTRALDFGCGTGQVGMRLGPLVGSVAMVDTSEGMLQVLRGKMDRDGITNLVIHQGDLFQEDLEKDGYDLGCCLMALHHVKNVPALLNRFGQLLAPGGLLCIADLEPEDGSFHGEELDVHHGFEPGALGRVLEESGFSVKLIKRLLELKKTDGTGTNRCYPIFFLEAQKT